MNRIFALGPCIKILPYKPILNTQNNIENIRQNSNYKGIFSYPLSYYQNYSSGISFGNSHTTIKSQMQKLSKEHFPSEKLYNLALEEAENNSTKTLYDIHTEYYAPLSKCSTLDEAKALYPEFQDVIDAKDLNITSNMRIIQKIAAGKIEGLSLDNLALTFLKKFYVEGAGIADKNKWFNISSAAIINIAETLNIKKPDNKYTGFYKSSNPNTRAIMSASAKRYQAGNDEAKKRHSERMKQYFKNPENKKEHKAALDKYWSNPKNRELKSEQLKKFYEEHPEKRQEQSKTMTDFYQNNPKEKEARLQKARENSHTDEANKKRSEAMSEHYKNPVIREQKRQEQLEFHRAHPERGALLSRAWNANEEIIKTMQETAKNEFPNLGRILNKGTKSQLTEAEEAYRRAYLARCRELCPDMEKTIGETYAKMLHDFEENN